MENQPTFPPSLPTHPAIHAVQLILSLGLTLFCVHALICLADDSMKLFFETSILTPFRGFVGFAAFLGGLVVYLLIGVTPLVPKRYFLTLTLFPLVAGLSHLPLLTFYYAEAAKIAWVTSLCHVLLTLGILFLLQRSRAIRWPLVPGRVLGNRLFSGWHLCLFVLLNLFLLLPAVLGITATAASVAISHFTEGFVSLRPAGLIMHERTYHRDSDGAIVHLIPMSHVAQSSFYSKLATSLPADALILAEGVSDTKNQLKTKIGYGKTAASLGLAEQSKEFKPQATQVPADVDLSEFSPTTVAYLKTVMTVHSQGLTAQNLPAMLENPPPDLLEKLLHDLLTHRNRHLLQVLEKQLVSQKNIIIPWGAAHMPGIAEGVLKMGFYQVGSEEHTAIPFLR